MQALMTYLKTTNIQLLYKWIATPGRLRTLSIAPYKTSLLQQQTTKAKRI